MKTALFLTDYDLSTVHYLCSYYKDNANLDAQDVEYINELQSRVDKLMEVKMKIEINKEQLELLKYAVLWYECNDEEEERIIDELETKLYNAQEQDLLRSVTNMGGLN